MRPLLVTTSQSGPCKHWCLLGKCTLLPHSHSEMDRKVHWTLPGSAENCYKLSIQSRVRQGPDTGHTAGHLAKEAENQTFGSQAQPPSALP